MGFYPEVDFFHNLPDQPQSLYTWNDPSYGKLANSLSVLSLKTITHKNVSHKILRKRREWLTDQAGQEKYRMRSIAVLLPIQTCVLNFDFPFLHFGLGFPSLLSKVPLNCFWNDGNWCEKTPAGGWRLHDFVVLFLQFSSHHRASKNVANWDWNKIRK